MSDFIIPSESDKNEGLSQIDVLHEEHRLKVLNDLADDYNDNLSPMRYPHDHIRKKYRTKAFDLIFSLWMRGVKVPEGMGLGEPYDSAFSVYMAYVWSEDYSVEKCRVVMLLRNPLLIRFYMVSGVDTREGSNHLVDINRCIQQLRKKDGSQWEMVSCRDQLRDFLLNPELSDLDIMFLAIAFEKTHVYYTNFSIVDIHYFLMGMPH